MSSTACVCLILSLGTLYLVSGTTWCRCITRPVAVADRWPTTLTPDCSRYVAPWLIVMSGQSC
jgi:hypothetical protein